MSEPVTSRLLPAPHLTCCWALSEPVMAHDVVLGQLAGPLLGGAPVSESDKALTWKFSQPWGPGVVGCLVEVEGVGVGGVVGPGGGQGQEERSGEVGPLVQPSQFSC